MNRIKRLLAFVAVAVTVLGMMPPASAETGVGDPGSPTLPDSIETAKDPGVLLDPRLALLVEDDATADLDGVTQEGDRVLVEVLHDIDAADAATIVVDAGGEVVQQAVHVTLAWLPASSLVAVEETSGVEMVRVPARIDAEPQTVTPTVVSPLVAAIRGGSVDVTRADTWHDAGITGTGVRVGIIDYFDDDLWSLAQAAGDLPAPSGTFLAWNGAISHEFPDQNNYHGVAVAEIVHDMAPDAEIFIATVFGVTDLAAAIAYFDDNGVDIISRSLGSAYDGPGDGTGAIDDVVADAVARGMLWVNSAGNSAGRNGRVGMHWRGAYSDADGDGWIEFEGGSELNEIEWASCFFGGFRWSDWNEDGVSDYDLYFFEDEAAAQAGIWEARLYGDQGGGAKPIETIATSENGIHPCDTTDSQRDRDFIAIKLYDAGAGTSTDVLQLTGPFLLDHWTNPYSASQPAADSNSPGVISAGAMEPLNGTSIANYSSEGPTNDGRVKPDLSASVCIAGTAVVQVGRQCTDGSIGFTGTSAAAPVISGAAALVLDADLARTPAGVRNYLMTEAAVDRGAAGDDVLFGAGQLVLPDLTPAGTSAPRWPSNSALGADGDETSVTLSWSPATDPSGYRIYQAPGTLVDGHYRGRQIADVGPRTTFTVGGLEPGTAYAFWVEAYGSGGSISQDGPLRLVTTATDFSDTNGHLFERDVAWLSSAGVTSGCNPPTNDAFCPERPVTRGQMASFLVRALGLSAAGGNQFTDTSSSVHSADIDRLAAAGITAGCNPPANTQYCPEDPVTRGQMASFLVRALGLTAGASTDFFTDTSVSVHEVDINRLAHSGITAGCSETRFCPEDLVTRGQMAAFIRRAQDRIDASRSTFGLQPLGNEATAEKSITGVDASS